MGKRSKSVFHCLVCLNHVKSPFVDDEQEEDNYDGGWRNHQLFENFLAFCNQYLRIDGRGVFQIGPTQPCDNYGSLDGNRGNSLCAACEGLMANITDTHRQLLELEMKLLGKVTELEEMLGHRWKTSSSRATQNALKRARVQIGVSTEVKEIEKFWEDLIMKYRAKHMKSQNVEQAPSFRVNEGKCSSMAKDVADHEDALDFIKVEVDPPGPLDAENNWHDGDELEAFESEHNSDNNFKDSEGESSSGEIPSFLRKNKDDSDYAPDEDGEPATGGRVKRVRTRRSRKCANSDNDEESPASKTLYPKRKLKEYMTWNKRFKDRPSRLCNPCNQAFHTYMLLVKHEKKMHFFESTLFQKLPCHKCETLTTFPSPEALYDHLAAEHDDDEDKVLLRCEVCKKDFPNFKELYAHLESTHEKSGEAYMLCVYCDQAFATQQFRDLHKFLKHLDKPRGYYCDQNPCTNLEFSTFAKLNEHLATCHDETLFNCEKCGMGFSSAYLCQLHEINHFKPDAEDWSFKCTKCDSGFVHRTQLLWHYNKHHGNSSKIKLLGCTKCSMFYCCSSNELESHVGSHNWDLGKLFQCTLCKMEFMDDKDAVYNHLKEVHGHTEPGKYRKVFMCDTCSLEFPSCRKLSQHKLDQHTGRKEMCQYCGKAFKKKWILAEHVREVHTREGLAYCDQCGNGYGSVSRLNKHVNEVHNKSLKCPLCPKVFGFISHLEMHVATHSGGKRCKWCNKNYPQVVSLLKHVKTTHPEHLEEFSLEEKEALEKLCKARCKECGKGFPTEHGLKVHIVRDHGMEWLKCPICPDRKCADKDKMNNHLRRHGKGVLGQVFTLEAVSRLFEGIDLDIDDPHNRLKQEDVQTNSLMPSSSKYSVPENYGGVLGAHGLPMFR